MTGNEHYAEGERLIDGAADFLETVQAEALSGKMPKSEFANALTMHASVIAAAQVHATLALASFAKDYLPGRMA